MPDNQVYVLDGKRYTVPKGTSLDEVQSFIETQSAPAAQQAPKSWWEGFKGRVSDVLSASPTDPRTLTEAQAAQGIDPRQQALNERLSEAQAVASLGATSEIGAPRSAPAISALRESPAMLREGVAVAGRSPSGALRPLVKAGSRAAGAALGHEIAGVEGAVVGGLTGPTVAEAMIPRRAVLQQLMRPANEARLPTNEAARPVIVADEPLPPQPGVPPGSMQSVPREELPGNIAARRAGAAEAHRAAGGTVIYRGGPEGYPVRTGKVGMETTAPEPKPANAAATRIQPGRIAQTVQGSIYDITHPNPAWSHGAQEAFTKMSGAPLHDIVGTLRGKGLSVPSLEVPHGLAEEMKMIGEEVPGKFNNYQRSVLEPLFKQKFASQEELTQAINTARSKLGLETQ